MPIDYGSFEWPPAGSGGGGGGVSSLNSLTGALTLVAGAGITLTPSGSSITIAAPGGSGTVTAVTASSPLFSSGGNTPNLTIQQATTSQDGYLSSTDWNTFNSKGVGTVTSVTGTGPVVSSGGTTPAISMAAATGSVNGYLAATDFNKFKVVYYHYPVDAPVVENDIVMSITDINTGQAPLFFKQAINGGQTYYPALYGVAKNVSGGFADIFMGFGTVIDGFSFGAFVGVEYYLDGANPGKITWVVPAVGSSVNPIKIGRAMDATHLILMPIGNFVQEKGGLYTSDGSYDETIAVGANGQVLVADSAQIVGLSWAPAVVAAAPFTYTTSTRTLTIATATNSVAGVLSAADHTTFAGYAATIALKAPLASPTFTGDVNVSTGNLLISTIGKGLQVKTGTNSKIGTAVLVAGTVTVANTSVTANSRIFLTSQADGGTPGFVRITAKVVGTSFTITGIATDTSTIAWMIVEIIP